MAIRTLSRINKGETDRKMVFDRILQAFGEGTTIWYEEHYVLDIIEVRMWNEQLSGEENRAIFNVFFAWWEYFAKDRYPDYLVLLREPEVARASWIEEDPTTPWDFEV